MERIVIEGQIIRHERVETINEAPLEALAQHLTRPIATTLPVLPAHPVRYITFDGENGRGLILAEQAPGLRRIRMDHAGRAGNFPDAERRTEGAVGVWRVWFPWQYFAFPFTTNQRDGFGTLHNFTLGETRLYWSREQYRRVDHPLWVAPVPNVDANARICWGGTQTDGTSLSARIDDYINSFSITTFNDHLGHNTPFGESLTEWENHSPVDGITPWLDWDIWNGQSITVADIHRDLPRPDMAQLDPSYIEYPELPTSFTVARARQYLEGLPANTRQRMLAAATAILAGDPAEETTA